MDRVMLEVCMRALVSFHFLTLFCSRSVDKRGCGDVVEGLHVCFVFLLFSLRPLWIGGSPPVVCLTQSHRSGDPEGA